MRERTRRDISYNKTLLYSSSLESYVDAVYIQKQNQQIQTEVMNCSIAQMINLPT